MKQKNALRKVITHEQFMAVVAQTTAKFPSLGDDAESIVCFVAENFGHFILKPENKIK